MATRDPLERLVVGLHDRGMIQFSDFGWMLKSGRLSPIYYNQRPLMSFDKSSSMPSGMQRAVVNDAIHAYRSKIDMNKADHIYGIPQAMTHLAGAVALEGGFSSLWGRVGEKEYGRHQGIEGAYTEGQRVIQLDDVVTNAGSKLESAEALAEQGLVTAGFVVMLDRQEGGVEAVTAAGYTIQSIVGLSTAVDVLRQNNRIGAQEVGWVQMYHEQLLAEGEISTYWHAA